MELEVFNLILTIILIIVLFAVFYYLYDKFKVELSKIDKRISYDKKQTTAKFKQIEDTISKSINELQNIIKHVEVQNNSEHEEIRTQHDDTRAELQLFIDNIKTELEQRIEENAEQQTQNSQILSEKIEVSVETIKDELYEKINANFSLQSDLIKKIEETITNDKIENYNLIKNILNTLTELNKEYADLKEKIYFFANIEEDSKQLNDISKTEAGILQETELIEKALLELSKPKVENQTKKPDETEEIIISDEDVTETDESIILDDDDEEIDTIINEVDDFEIDDEKVPSILDDNQKEAFKIMTYKNDNLLITGRAGTGKSLLLNIFSRSTKKKILVIAPTGIAALNVGGATIHSTFGFKNLVELDIDDISPSTILLNSAKKEVLRKVETIIIDEISMLRSDVLERMNKILQCINNNDEIFGGKQMIFIGDPFQLPPVVRKNEQYYLNDQYGGEYFFMAPVYKQANFKFVELTINHRQDSDPVFFDILNHIREGKIRKKDLDLLNSRVIDGDDKSLHRVIRLYATKAEVEATNNKILDTIFGKEYEFECQIEYSKYNNQTVNIENNFPFPQILKLKIGANVMFISNDRENRWVNGTIGIVKSISNDVIQVVVNDTVFNVERISFSQKDAVYTNGKITYEDNLKVKQFPIILSYAITIHKSQGMTYPNIACDISNCFEYGQEYVALSRTISLNGLHLLKPISFDNINIAPKVSKFYWECLINAENN